MSTVTSFRTIFPMSNEMPPPAESRSLRSGGLIRGRYIIYYGNNHGEGTLPPADMVSTTPEERVLDCDANIMLPT